MPRTRCPNGTHKNKSGECISVTEVQVKNTTRKRCPKGTRKTKSGECASIDVVKKPKTSIYSPQTPRTKYEKTHFANKPIIMLDKLHPGDKTAVFQVGFDNPKQFKDYTNLSKNPTIDCFYQSLFSLGLRKAETAKKDAAEINLKGIEGVSGHDIANYLTKSFDLKLPQKIEYILLDMKINDKLISDNKIANKTITKFFQDNLKDNHASIFTLRLYYEQYDKTIGHALIVYKYKNKIYFFDPQHKGIRDDKLTNSRSLLNFIQYYYNPLISRFAHFVVHNIDNPIYVKNTECPIPYTG